MAEKDHQPFLDAIHRDPDDLATYGVYADWLCEHNDPRGEFTQIQLELEDPSLAAEQRSVAKAREAELLAEHERDWLGELSQHLLPEKPPTKTWRERFFLFGPHLQATYKYTFARGFLDSIDATDLVKDFAVALKSSPHVRMLRRLVLRDCTFADALAGASFDNLRTFDVGEDSIEHVDGKDLWKLVQSMPRIESLTLESRDAPTEQIFGHSLPHLRTLAVHHSTHYPLEILAANASLSNLESIAFYPHALHPEDNAAYITLAGFQALCEAGENFPKLQHITMYCTDIGDQGLALLVQSPLLKQLRTLDLSYGRVQDAGAEVLASADLSGLGQLILDGNYLSPHGIDVLRRSNANLRVNLKADNQFGGDPDPNREYLFFGDIE